MSGNLDVINVMGRKVYDSWGNPALEAEVVLENGAQGRAIVPIPRKQDINREREFLLNQLSECIMFEDASNQAEIDRLLIKKYMEKREIGVGSCGVIGLSMAVARAAGAGLFLPLYRYLGGTSAPVMPAPMFSMISGGDREKGIDFQELAVIPKNMKTYGEGLRMGAEIYHTLKKQLMINGYDISTGDAGGFTADMKNTEEALRYVMEAIELAGYIPGIDAEIGIYAAADRLYKKEDGIYNFEKEGRHQGEKVHRNRKEMMNYYLRLADRFPVSFIMNGLWRYDIEGQEQMMEMLGQRLLLSFKDTDKSNVDMIELMQAGTVAAVLDMVQQAKMAGHKIIIANDFMETEESFAADLAAAIGADYVRCKTPRRGDYGPKHNELLRIEEFYFGRQNL